MKPWVDFKAIKAAADFRPVLAHYGLELKAKGPELTGLCPFHQDTRPSFRVNLEKQVFHCFGCGAKGNVLDFVSRKEGVAIRKAAELVAQWCGVEGTKRPVSANTKIATPLPKSPPRGTQEPARQSEGPKTAQHTSPAAGVAVEATRPQGVPADIAGGEAVNRPLTFTLKLDPAHPYLAERDLAGETIAHFGLGYCSRGVMKGRIAIAIHDAGGDLVAYAGRWPGDPPEGEPKYRLPDGFKKSLVLYNLNRVVAFKAPHGDRILLPLIVVEGYWSVFRLHQLGYPNVVALMGKEFSFAQEQLLAAHADRAIVMMDGDPAGREAQAANVARLARRLYVRAVDVPEGSQPDTLPEAELRALLAVPS